MEKFRLVSMVDFVLEQGKPDVDADLFYFLCSNYAEFLKQPLTLGIFVPCDEYGNVLEEPLKEDYEVESDGFSIVYDAETYEYDVTRYSDAKERVLFDGFELIKNNTLENSWCRIYFIKFKNGNTSFELTDYSEEGLPKYNVKTIEDLIVVFNLTLTPSALKQIGL